MTKSYDEGHVGWLDFEPEPDGTGDGSGDPDKHILTIVNDPGGDNDEIAVIVHRTVGGKYPIDGALANRKRRIAQVICDALNDGSRGERYADQLDWTDEEAEAVRPKHHIEVKVENVYPDGTVRTNAEAEVPLPPLQDLDEWAEEHLMPLTGTGRTEGDAGYFLTITKFDARPELVGTEYEWGI